MSSYSIAEAEAQLARLIDKALSGEQVTLTRNGKPVAELTASAPLVQDMASDTLQKGTTEGMLELLRKHRESLPFYEGDSVADIRAMRDDF